MAKRQYFGLQCLDKVLIDTILRTGRFSPKSSNWVKRKNVLVLGQHLKKATNVPNWIRLIWYEEFLDYKIVIGTTNSDQEAKKINKYCGGHSASIILQMILLHKNLWKMSIRQPFIIMHQHDLRMEDNLVLVGEPSVQTSCIKEAHWFTAPGYQ
jgi:hypothetical protein